MSAQVIDFREAKREAELQFAAASGAALADAENPAFCVGCGGLATIAAHRPRAFWCEPCWAWEPRGEA
jgi:hypothetical protein